MEKLMMDLICKSDEIYSLFVDRGYCSNVTQGLYQQFDVVSKQFIALQKKGCTEEDIPLMKLIKKEYDNIEMLYWSDYLRNASRS